MTDTDLEPAPRPPSLTEEPVTCPGCGSTAVKLVAFQPDVEWKCLVCAWRWIGE